MLHDLARLLLPAAVETVAMVLVSTAFAGVLGAPIGIALVVWASDGLVPRPRTYQAVATVVDVGRSVPFVIAMVALMPLTRALVGTSIGTAAAIVPLVVAAIPFVARIVESALREVPRSTVEAVVGMGASPLQVVRAVYLAEAKAALVRGRPSSRSVSCRGRRWRGRWAAAALAISRCATATSAFAPT